MTLLGMLLAVAPTAGSEPIPVPAGSFRQGDGRSPDASPMRTVTLGAYRIDRTEVTVADFERFVAAGGYRDARWWSEDGWAWARAHPDGAGAELRASGRAGEHPVVAVTWYEADAWCRWAGGALPTEAQWERAACGPDGAPYPWGTEPDFRAAWYGEGKYGNVRGVNTRPAGEQDADLASPLGLIHAAGNVWEWTADGYRADAYAAGDATDPVAPGGRWRTLRGGSYMNLPSYATCTHREPARPDDLRLTVGFRCAWP